MLGSQGARQLACRSHRDDTSVFHGDGQRLRRALAILGASDPARAGQIEARVRELVATPSGLRPDPLLIGDDLIELGLTPGPAFRSILDAVYDAQLEGEIGDRESAIALAERISR